MQTPTDALHNDGLPAADISSCRCVFTAIFSASTNLDEAEDLLKAMTRIPSVHGLPPHLMHRERLGEELILKQQVPLSALTGLIDGLLT